MSGHLTGIPAEFRVWISNERERPVSCIGRPRCFDLIVEFLHDAFMSRSDGLRSFELWEYFLEKLDPLAFFVREFGAGKPPELFKDHSADVIGMLVLSQPSTFSSLMG